MTFEKSSLGFVHIYTGEGKGKTSAGMGLVIRALGRGLKVKIIQLFKRDTGEQFFFENSGVKYLQFKPLHPYFKNYDQTQIESLKEEFLEFWTESLKDIDEYDLILIDELGPGLNWMIIPESLVFDLIENKPKNTELIFTGRDFPESVKERADYVSEIKKIKHPYDKGIFAREGIEY
ncbi:hypothetical protein AUJ61_02270 [Candidatus Pacearchaeota archaeon CG1_02_30_18]|nr:MAG: hypothetical protein AUJ61_02270 [Candidatus Pacearchaeota archaeon CG1_02_30_18]PIN71075.1 MAG: cob(I)yrinic acid a,c-diamide adenosyltransferase [Candidatus Pacearchaeota archaeon CG11_big_fil_rev_8_21_14_0_20_30_13]PIZ82145.1 MAG: cob(I)yrinic acid a,c-diamide adenosyltransferase [Candidatus Pacearchaeota archaeon CG_4_10_14_0_2_um_filter_30_11]PJA71146.1 MAG: cob(I)yrinic acid a,c-diamide adenosyltransferase [Candidatus Pacearchaeota archaeon CG_4_9_14_3_um_filter_30_11]